MMSRFARYAWGVLGTNLLVILWGAYVRASGSGAGCGAHWPLCNGVIVPREPSAAMLVEFAHRASSGIAVVTVFVLAAWSRRVFPKGAQARTASHVAAFFIVTEALIGAGLVLFRMVADNESVARGWWISAHLTNTFLLLASLTIAAVMASGAPPMRRGHTAATWWAAFGVPAFALLLGVSGAIAALGDTLFPVTSLGEGFRSDANPSAHAFVRLRAWHPALAIAFAIVAIPVLRMAARNRAAGARRAASLATMLVVLQLAAGFANLLLLAPVPLQLLHLFLADATWVALVVYGAALLA